MLRRLPKSIVASLAALLMLSTAVNASADPDHDDAQHGGFGGHLPASAHNMEFVGRVDVSGATGVDKPGHIADVAAKGNYAYLAARRLNTNPCGTGGFYVIDISNPAAPTEVGFVAFPPHSYPGEGMQVVSLNTPHFRGDVLIANNENCGSDPRRVGGLSLYDVTNPRNVVPLVVGFGDTNGGVLPRANPIHSAFAWQAERRAYAVTVDNNEQGSDDTDIYDISNPRAPRMIAEVGRPDWPALSVVANGETVNLHDMVVKKVRGDWLMLLSYWDAGWIVLNVNDPANPVYVGDSDHPNPDLLGFIPEGNAHQAEWSHNNKYIIGTDEDFSPNRTRFEITSGPNAGQYGAGEFGWTVPIATKYAANGGVLQGRTVWGGSGCVEDTDGNGVSDRAEVPPASSIPAAPGESKIVVFSRGTCFFSVKVESGQLAGYDDVIIGQSHAGAGRGTFPNAFTCGAQGHSFTATASALCIGHRAMHLLFNDAPEFSDRDGADMPALGTLGERVSARGVFDGWGYVHLLDAATLQTIDSFALPETLDPTHATGSGTMSVHEVAMDKAEDLAYLSWYDAGMRTVRFGPGGIEEVGHYVAPGGNDFWGVEAHRLPGSEQTLILGSDRDSGLWIFRYTGP